jgi:hypothetical protein
MNLTMCLPLPLAAFEDYMLADDRPAYPMTFFFRLRFSGRLDRAALRAAARAAVARHPLLGAVIHPANGKKRCWVTVEDPAPSIYWVEDATADGLPHATEIDLTREPGLRIWAADHDDGTDITLQFHHSCCDGLGAFAFVKDLLVCYALAVGAEVRRGGLTSLDPQHLPLRADFGLTLGKLLRMAHKQAVGLLGVREFLMHAPVPMVPHDPAISEAAPPEAFPASLTGELDEDRSSALHDAAKASGVTINDILIRDLFLSLYGWRQRHYPAHACRWLRMSVPMNLRAVDDRLRRLPAANVVSMVFLDRRDKEFSDPAALLDGIHQQMEKIKRLDLGLTFVFSVRAFRALPGGLANMTQAKKCMSTCVLTNLGAPLAGTPLPSRGGKLAIGEVLLDGLDILAPIRPFTCAAVAAFKYANRQCFTLHYDPRWVTPGHADELLGDYVCRTGGTTARRHEARELLSAARN